LLVLLSNVIQLLLKIKVCFFDVAYTLLYGSLDGLELRIASLRLLLVFQDQVFVFFILLSNTNLLNILLSLLEEFLLHVGDFIFKDLITCFFTAIQLLE